ncbi:MAG: hypothetical protein R3A10_01625 [Caldilineaceae bacterium]
MTPGQSSSLPDRAAGRSVDGPGAANSPLPAPVHGDVGHFQRGSLDEQHVRFLPRTLPDALAALESDQVVADALGPVPLPEFIRAAAELEAYDLTVHQWERDIYLETL